MLLGLAASYFYAPSLSLTLAYVLIAVLSLIHLLMAQQIASKVEAFGKELREAQEADRAAMTLRIEAVQKKLEEARKETAEVHQEAQAVLRERAEWARLHDHEADEK